MDTHYIVQTAHTTVPRSCLGKYRKVAVLEVDAGIEHVSMISPRAKGCHRVVEVWDRCHMGKTPKSAYFVALEAAHELASRLNGEGVGRG